MKKPQLTGILFLLLSLFISKPIVAAESGENIAIRMKGLVATDVARRITVKQIEAIGTEDAEVYNPYEKRKDHYTGVWMSDFVKHFAKPNVTQLSLTAIDDYSINFLESDWSQLRIMIATRINGQYIGYDKKGPMRIVYVDYNPDEKVYQETLPNWMWMINRVEFK